MSNKNIIVIAAVVLAVIASVAFYFYGRENVSAPAGNDKSNLIKVFNVSPDQAVKSPLLVEGEARGYWYFEASFPIRMFDANGKELGVAVAQAKDEWMTESFVPFSTTINFTKPTTSNGFLVLQKDNPSGLPEHDDELRVPVKFADFSAKPIAKQCVVSGCSGQVCGEESVTTTCEYREEYACYKSAQCERQANGECGWTETSELRLCLGR